MTIKCGFQTQWFFIIRQETVVPVPGGDAYLLVPEETLDNYQVGDTFKIELESVE